MLEYPNNENKNLCALCGGACCKFCGCAYLASDIEEKKQEYIEQMLDTGLVSIVAELNFIPDKTGKLNLKYLLILRARNIGKGEIDLFSTPSGCSALTEDGCTLNWDERPSLGKLLVPVASGHCFTDFDSAPKDDTEKWLKMQNILKKIVRKKEHMSVEVVLRRDVKNIFMEVRNASIEERSSKKFSMVRSIWSSLIIYYNKEYEEAYQASLKTPLVRARRRYTEFLKK